MASHLGLLVQLCLLHVLSVQANPELVWSKVKMPQKSYFMGFEPPTDQRRWKMALMKAITGEQVLLNRALKAVKTPNDFISVDERMNKIFQVKLDYILEGRKGDIEPGKTWRGEEIKPISRGGGRAPIVMFGRHYFKSDAYKEGSLESIITLPPNQLVAHPEKLILKERVVALGLPNENWGWASTQFLNRSVSWNINLAGDGSDPFSKGFKYPDEALKPFLDREEIILMLVNQHHNISHPKLLSMPLGVPRGSEASLFDAMYHMKALNVTKDPSRLLLSIGSHYAYRPAIRDCVGANLGEDVYDTGINRTHPAKKRARIGGQAFKKRVSTAYAVLCLPGLGVDTFRLWETLAMGAMPVMEKGLGLDRTVFKLPVLLVEDFADINESMLRQAYVEALYIALDPCHDDPRLYRTPKCMTFEMERMTWSYWEELIWEASLTRSMDAMLVKHPMNATDTGFTRPLVPFSYESSGPGTKKVPKKSCGIDMKIDYRTYNYAYP